MEWLRDHMWETWLGLSVVLTMAEMFSLDLVMIMLAVGALAGMVTALIGLGIPFQVVVAAAASVGMLAVVRPPIAKRFHGGPDLRLGPGKLVGTQGLVTEKITSLEPGRAKIDGEVWSALPYDETLVIEPGATIEVLEIRGATAYVHPIPSLEP